MLILTKANFLNLRYGYLVSRSVTSLLRVKVILDGEVVVPGGSGLRGRHDWTPTGGVRQEADTTLLRRVVEGSDSSVSG